MKNKLLNYIVIGISLLIFVSFLIFTHGLKSSLEVMGTMDEEWIFAALFFMVVFWLLETAILYIILRTTVKMPHLWLKTLRVAMTGQFFSAVTPLQLGGQPAQLLAMQKLGMGVDCSSSALIVKFIIHQSTFILYSLVAVIFSFRLFSSRIPLFLPFSILGFFINTVILLLLLFSISRRFGNLKWLNKSIAWVLKQLSRFSSFRKQNITLETVKDRFSGLHDCSKNMISKRRTIIASVLLTFLQWTVFYSIPYFIYRSFGYHSTGYVTMLAAQVLLMLFMSFIPLPGAAGGAEGGFYIVYGMFLSASRIVPAILFWRLLTYYLTIAAGALFTLLPASKKTNEK